MAAIDPNDLYVHSVLSSELQKYLEGTVLVVNARCGKLWAPKKPISTDKKENCPNCFPMFTSVA